MKISVVTLFPAFFRALDHSIPGRAIASGALIIERINPRDFARDKHRTVDDAPYGGGAGMVMRPDVLVEAVEYARATNSSAPVVYLSPQGAPFVQRHAAHLASLDGLILVCGRYEGVDERFIRECVDFEISVGDFVLTGGEPAALCVIDAVVRLLPGVLGNDTSAVEESFGRGLLEHPHFTRPRTFRGAGIPDVLVSGDHGRVDTWREAAAWQRTVARRADLLPPETEFAEPTTVDPVEDWIVDPRHLQVAVDD